MIPINRKKNKMNELLYLSVEVFSTALLIRDTTSHLKFAEANEKN